MANQSFLNLLELIRSGDNTSVQQFMSEYGPCIQREIRRSRILNGPLRRLVGESDIYQSVMGRFLLGVRAGEYELEAPGQAVGLLKKIVAARLADLLRYHLAHKRDIRGDIAIGGVEYAGRQGAHSDPSMIVGNQELVHLIRKQFSADEWELFQLRQDGLGWDEIAVKLHNPSQEAIRKKLSRAVTRVSQHLGWQIEDLQ